VILDGFDLVEGAGVRGLHLGEQAVVRPGEVGIEPTRLAGFVTQCVTNLFGQKLRVGLVEEPHVLEVRLSEPLSEPALKFEGN
jgi:hypothetical protein